MSGLEEKPSRAQTLQGVQIERDLRAVLSTPEGRRTMMWFLGLCRPGSAYAGPGLGDATHFMLGEKNVGDGVVRKLNEIDPTIYPTLLLEEVRRQWPNEEEDENEFDDE